MDADGTVRLAAAAWAAARAHAERQAPDECCGLLIGHAGRIETAWPAQNASPTPGVRYQVNPADHFAALHHGRTQGLDVVGAYHSHPRSAPVPSPVDLAEAMPDFVYLILGPMPDEAWTPRAFLLVQGNFAERTLVFEA